MKQEFPDELRKQLAIFGSNLRVARVRRGETQEEFARRLGVTRLTLAEMEKGSPTVSFGSYANALWIIGMADDLCDLASPDRDTQGKAAERERDPERVRAKQERDRERFNF